MRPTAAFGLALALVLGAVPGAAQAEEVNLTPGPTIIADPNSPTGYTGHFVYCNPTATSVRFVADIMLRNWEDPTDTKIYTPFEYEPGLMRGGGGYDVEMTNGGNGCWYTDVPLAAGANQYWFYVNNNTNLWVADPANSPIFAPDGLTGNARRAFNKVHVPYDPVKQNYAPLEARQIENPRPDSPKGTWSYVEIPALPPLGGTIPRTIGVYLPPDYDPNRAEPYKTIYMQHGGGQDQSDWMNMGDVPVIMDNLIQDGTTEPAIVITTNTNYLGAANQGYPNLRNIVIPFVEANYNVSEAPIDRAFAGLSAGSFVTQNLMRFDTLRFGYYGPWSGGISVPTSTVNIDKPYILYGGGRWDFGLPNANTVAALDQVAFVENVVVAGAHDFNAWNQLFTIWARDYLWHPDAFLADEINQIKAGVDTTSLNKGNKNALTVKLEQALKLVTKGESDGALEVLDGFVTQVDEFT
ncbi:MAG TPA: alpha/beta hydrolase-fold protein, partial [Microbacterium sp.]|nr:alpha/beta hydrolase-fold protein [Microbacterium sp.]